MKAASRWRVAVGPLSTTLLLAALPFAACSVTPGEDVAAVGGGCPSKGMQSTLSVLRLRSPDLSESERDVWVYRPITPDAETLPVLYVLHGSPGEPEDIFTKSICTYLDARNAAGDPPFVVAAPDGNGAAHSDTEWADSKNGEDSVESFVTEAVIPAAKVHARGTATTGRSPASRWVAMARRTWPSGIPTSSGS